MKNVTLISVVIPAYNAEQFLDETLESVLSQTYENWECIIVNDGSTDKTESIAKKWCEKDARFRYFYKENSGASDTRNLGIKEARGEYIAFLDADDLYMPNFLEVCIENLVEKDVDLVAPKMLEFWDVQNEVIEDEDKKDYLYRGKEGIALFLHSNRLTMALLCKKSVMDEVGGFTWHKKAEDLHCWLKVLFAGYKIYRLGEYYAYRRIHQNSWSNSELNCTQEIVEIIHNFKQKIVQKNINFHYFFNLWVRRYILLKDRQGKILPNIKKRMEFINSIDSKYFPKILLKLPLGEKLTKLLAIQIIKFKKFSI